MGTHDVKTWKFGSQNKRQRSPLPGQGMLTSWYSKLAFIMKFPPRPVPSSDFGGLGGHLTSNVDQWRHARGIGGLSRKFWNKCSISSLKKWTFVELGGAYDRSDPPPRYGPATLALGFFTWHKWWQNKPRVPDCCEHSSYSVCTPTHWFAIQILLLPTILSPGWKASMLLSGVARGGCSGCSSTPLNLPLNCFYRCLNCSN